MNKSLASNRENTQKAAGRVVSGADRLPLIILRDLPPFAEIELLACGKGAWLTEDELQERADAASIALFGLERRDTLSWSSRGDDPWTDADEAEWNSRPDDWEDNFEVLDPDQHYLTDDQWINFWHELGYDATDERGLLLRCMPNFARQLIALADHLLPSAKFTPDGSGKRGAASPEVWGAAMERAARNFKPCRR